ncbi:MAG TPA: hypothetical protein VJ110_00175, partial [Candidatus Nanoarchaeia archaeon]|nr:hypothetical protein [Candidatus Nanoarchaeia archaeon]
MANPMGRMSANELLRQAEEKKVLSGKAPAEVDLLDESVFTPEQRKRREEFTAELHKPFPEPWDAAERVRKFISQQKYEPAKMLVDQILSGNQPQKW